MSKKLTMASSGAICPILIVSEGLEGFWDTVFSLKSKAGLVQRKQGYVKELATLPL